LSHNKYQFIFYKDKENEYQQKKLKKKKINGKNCTFWNQVPEESKKRSSLMSFIQRGVMSQVI
jgi:hypothetical protein